MQVESLERLAKLNASKHDASTVLKEDDPWHSSHTVQNRRTQLIHKPKLPAAAMRYRREVVGLMQHNANKQFLFKELSSKGSSEQFEGNILPKDSGDNTSPVKNLCLPGPSVDLSKKDHGFVKLEHKHSNQMKEVQQAVSRFMLPIGSPKASKDKVSQISLPQIAVPGLAKDTKHSTISGSFDPAQTLSIRHRSPAARNTLLPSSHSGYLFSSKSSNNTTMLQDKPMRLNRSNNRGSVLRGWNAEGPLAQHANNSVRTNRQQPLADYFRERIVKVSDYYLLDAGLMNKVHRQNKHSVSSIAESTAENLFEINRKLLQTEEVRVKFEEAMSAFSPFLQSLGINEISGIGIIQLLLNYDASVPKSTLVTLQKSEKQIKTTTTSSPTISQLASPRYMASKATQSTGRFVYMEKSFSVKCFAEGYLRHTLLCDKSFGLFSLNPSYYRLHVEKISKFLEKVLSVPKIVELRSSTNMQLCYKLGEEKRTYKRLLSVACTKLKLDPSDIDEKSTTEMNNPFTGHTLPLDSLEAKMVEYLFFLYTPEFVSPEFERNKQQTKNLLELKFRSLEYPKGIDPADFLELQEVMRAGQQHDNASQGSDGKQMAKALEKRMNSLIMHEGKPQENSQRKFGTLHPSPGDFRSDWTNVLEQCVNKNVLALEDKEFDNIFGSLKEVQSAKKLKEMKAINVKNMEDKLKPMGRVKELLIYQREMGKRDPPRRKYKEDSEQA